MRTIKDPCLKHTNYFSKGLTVDNPDNPDLKDNCQKMWNDFNHTWLALLQKQKDVTIELSETGIIPQNHSLIKPDFLEDMVDKLVGLCDHLGKHGLVDYQYGLWEAEIVDGKFLVYRYNFPTSSTLLNKL